MCHIVANVEDITFNRTKLSGERTVDMQVIGWKETVTNTVNSEAISLHTMHYKRAKMLVTPCFINPHH